MGLRQGPFTWAILAAGVSCVWVGTSPGQYAGFGGSRQESPARQNSAGATAPGHDALLPGIPEFHIEQLPPSARAGVRRVLQQPTLFTHGPVEVFHGRPALYHWLLDHPDEAVRLWRRLGAKCMEITDRGNGRFGWTDGEGS